MPLPSGLPLVRLGRGQGSTGLFFPGQGAPLAAASLERVIAAGCSVVVGCGDAGSLLGQPLGDIVVVDSALRDEGTSYHYLPPAREVRCPPETVAALADLADENGVDCTIGTTWTTDGLFRQTKGMIERRRAEGCVVVEMETAAMFAVASFRGIRFGQYLVVGDDVSGPTWQDRGRLEADEVRRRALALALDAAARLAGIDSSAPAESD